MKIENDKFVLQKINDNVIDVECLLKLFKYENKALELPNMI